MLNMGKDPYPQHGEQVVITEAVVAHGEQVAGSIIHLV